MSSLSIFLLAFFFQAPKRFISIFLLMAKRVILLLVLASAAVLFHFYKKGPPRTKRCFVLSAIRKDALPVQIYLCSSCCIKTDFYLFFSLPPTSILFKSLVHSSCPFFFTKWRTNNNDLSPYHTSRPTPDKYILLIRYL